MKTNKTAISILSFFILNFSLLIPLKAQFLNAIGITLGGTMSNQSYIDRTLNTTGPTKVIFGGNASIFLELFSHDYFRWVTEVQFNQKGGQYSDSLNSLSRLNYLSWNNYLKVRYEMDNIIPYIMVGPRLEFPVSQSTNNPRITGQFVPLHVSLAAGAGVELVAYSPFKLFLEAFYNPDVMLAYSSNGMDIKNYAYELRIGLKYVFAGKKKFKDMDCNSPTYIPDF